MSKMILFTLCSIIGLTLQLEREIKMTLINKEHTILKVKR